MDVFMESMEYEGEKGGESGWEEEGEGGEGEGGRGRREEGGVLPYCP